LKDIYRNQNEGCSKEPDSGRLPFPQLVKKQSISQVNPSFVSVDLSAISAENLEKKENGQRDDENAAKKNSELEPKSSLSTSSVPAVIAVSKEDLPLEPKRGYIIEPSMDRLNKMTRT
jgi:hypothetical protein